MLLTRRTSLALLAALAAPWFNSSAETALDRYVAAPDPTYRFELRDTRPGDTATEYLIELTSQTWRSSAEVDHPVWTHWLTVIVPKAVRTSTGLLFITGGENDGKTPKSPEMLRSMAIDTGSVTAELRMVPNQPLTFAGETKGRVEDEIIVYTWDKFLRGGDERWPLRLPMVKSAVRAMDTVTAFCAGLPASVKVDRFVVSGASKRGWTTWDTAAVDKRVVAIMPIVIDVLNVEKSFDHHYRALGFYAPAVNDYVEMGIIDWSGTPQYAKLMAIEDPYSYLDRLTMPKFIVNSAGDQFFLPDSSRFYFDDLKGEKYLRSVPNSDHSLKETDASESLHAYYAAFLAGRERPKFTWRFEKDGSIRVKPQTTPSQVLLWQATDAEARDFRLEKIGPAYTSTVLQPQGGGEYVARVAKPAKGWAAYFVELAFPSGGKYPLKFTTAVRIAPDTLPFASPKHVKPPSAAAAAR